MAYPGVFNYTFSESDGKGKDEYQKETAMKWRKDMFRLFCCSSMYDMYNDLPRARKILSEASLLPCNFPFLLGFELDLCNICAETVSSPFACPLHLSSRRLFELQQEKR